MRFAATPAELPATTAAAYRPSVSKPLAAAARPREMRRSVFFFFSVSIFIFPFDFLVGWLGLFGSHVRCAGIRGPDSCFGSGRGRHGVAERGNGGEVQRQCHHTSLSKDVSLAQCSSVLRGLAGVHVSITSRMVRGKQAGELTSRRRSSCLPGWRRMRGAPCTERRPRGSVAWLSVEFLPLNAFP